MEKLTKMDMIEQIKNLLKAYESDTEMETHQALDKIKDIVVNSFRFNKGEITEETYNVIMHDLECLEIPQTQSNIYHYKLLKGNLQDLFGVTQTQSISEVLVGEVYTRDELYALCDWFAEEPNVIFGSVCGDACFRAEPDEIQKDKWCIKEYWRVE